MKAFRQIFSCWLCCVALTGCSTKSTDDFNGGGAPAATGGTTGGTATAGGPAVGGTSSGGALAGGSGGSLATGGEPNGGGTGPVAGAGTAGTAGALSTGGAGGTSAAAGAPSAAGAATGGATTGGMNTGGEATSGGAANNAGSAGQPTAGTAGAPACEKGVTEGDDVVIIGDSFFQNGVTHETLNTLARDAGALAANDSYRDNSVSGTQLSGGPSPTIPQQYANSQQESPIKVVIMDGGGNDMLNSTCSDPPTASCQGIQNAVAAVEELFPQMGSDGVEFVVFMFYPENQTNATQRAKVDVLRSLLQEVCSSSASPKCYEVDLRPVFEGHFDEYVLSDGIHPTAAGSEATGEAIWSVMQQNCVAQ